MFTLIRRLHAVGLTIMLVEQNVGQSLEVADQAHVLENGVVTLSGARYRGRSGIAPQLSCIVR